MERLGNDGVAHKARLVAAIAGIVLFAPIAPPATAQTPVDNAPSEAARRAALSPYRFILQNATAPARKPAPAAAPSPAAAPAPVAEPKRSAPAPVQQAAAQPAAPQPAPKPAETAATPAAPAPVPDPDSVAALSRPPVEPAPRREIIPIRTDEPRLSPSMAREQHGTVKVRFEINPDGSVGDVKVISSTNRGLNRATVDAVQGWKFEPVDEVLTVDTEFVYKFD